MIDAGVGLSTDNSSFKAGKDSAKDALSMMSAKPKLCILAVDNITRQKFDYQKVVDGVRDIIGPRPKLIGSTVNGVMVNKRFALKSVGVMLIGGDDIDIHSAFEFTKSRIEYKKIADSIYKMKKSLAEKNNQLLLMFQDGVKFPPEIMEQQKMLNNKMVSYLSGLVGRIFKKKLEQFKEDGMGMPSVQELITRLYDKGWDIPIIGNVATNLKNYESKEFFEDHTLEDACLGVFMSGSENAKFGYGFAAGAEPTGIKCKPTKAIGSFLLKIDDKPALNGFCEAVDIEPKTLANLENDGFVNFYYILGTQEKVGDRDYTHLVGTITNPELPNLVVSAFPFDKVPDQAEIFRSNMNILMKTTRQAVEEAVAGIKKPKFFLGIECVIRLLAYGDNLPKSIEIIDEILGDDVPRMILGSGGEIFGTKPNDYYFNNFTFLGFAGGY